MLKKNYKVKYVKEVFVESDSDWKDGDWVLIFKDEKKKEVTFKRTKTLIAADLEKGKEYLIKVDESFNPTYVKGKKWEIIRNGSRIIRHDLDEDTYYNLTARVAVDKNFKPLNGEKLSDGKRNYNTAALNKLMKGKLTIEELKKYNAKGIFFHLHVYEPKRNAGGGLSFGFNSTSAKNTFLIEKKSEKEIQTFLDYVVTSYLRGGIKKYFEITTNLV